MSTSLTKLSPNSGLENSFRGKGKIWGKIQQWHSRALNIESWRNVELARYGERFVNGQAVEKLVWKRRLQSFFLTVLCRVTKKALSLSLAPVSELFQLQRPYLQLLGKSTHLRDVFKGLKADGSCCPYLSNADLTLFHKTGPSLTFFFWLFLYQAN